MFRAAIYKGEVTPVFPYKTVTIGTQTWMAENLNEDDGETGVQTKTNAYEFSYSSNSYINKSDWQDGWQASVRLIKDAT